MKAKRAAPLRPTPEGPAAPADLNDAERAAWTETLEALGVFPALVSRADAGVLELVARQKAVFLEAARHVREHGAVAVARDDKGIVRFTQTTPEAQLVVKLGASLKALYETLGLTPAARARLALPEDAGGESALAKFMRGAS
jgi:P27 family predicted phage terminase small subunit